MLHEQRGRLTSDSAMLFVLVRKVTPDKVRPLGLDRPGSRRVRGSRTFAFGKHPRPRPADSILPSMLAVQCGVA